MTNPGSPVSPQAPAAVISLRIPGPATAKGRARFNTRTGHAYTPPETRVAENQIRATWIDAGEPRVDDDAAVRITIHLTVTRPAGHHRKDGSLSAEGRRHPIPRNRKPDVDNAAKLVMDSLNGRAYRDDVQVAELHVIRDWGDRPETRVTIAPIPVPAHLRTAA